MKKSYDFFSTVKATSNNLAKYCTVAQGIHIENLNFLGTSAKSCCSWRKTKALARIYRKTFVSHWENMRKNDTRGFRRRLVGKSREESRLSEACRGNSLGSVVLWLFPKPGPARTSPPRLWMRSHWHNSWIIRVHESVKVALDNVSFLFRYFHSKTREPSR